MGSHKIVKSRSEHTVKIDIVPFASWVIKLRRYLAILEKVILSKIAFGVVTTKKIFLKW